MAEFLGKQPQAAGEAQTAKSQSDLVPTLRRREANPSVPAGDKPTVSLQASVIRQIIDQPEPAAAGQEWTEAVRTQVRAAWDEVVESADLQERPGKAEITIKLKPETFGKVQVTVAVDDKGTVKAVLKPSDSRGARELAGLIPELKNALESRGVTQATVVIETNHWTTPNHNSQGQTAFGQGETPGSPYQQPHGQSRQENRHAPQSFREPVYGGANQEGTGFDYRV
jgi:flagellar hook-length control protein FliK